MGIIRRTVSRVLPDKARHALWYLRNRQLRLATEAARQVKKERGCVVLSGPFMGMKYVETSFGGAYPPKLLGTYEMELRGVIEEIGRQRYGRIVNIGASEGYYTVGLARMQLEADVIGYETRTAAHEALRNLAEFNGVDARVSVKGVCGATELAVDLRDARGRTLVVSDCEGWEQTLLVPETIGGLARADVLVETHDFVMPLVTRTVRKRFAETHDIELIPCAPRKAQDWPDEADFVGEKFRLAAMAEYRPKGQAWLWMKARGR